MRRTVFAFVFALFVSTAAQAVTLKDIVDLTKAGLGDEVLLALIEVDGGVFDVDPATLKSLKGAGVSERVIVALVRSGRERPVVSPDPVTLDDVVSRQTAPEVVYVERPAATVVREVAVAAGERYCAQSEQHHGASESRTTHHDPPRPGRTGPSLPAGL